MTTTLSTTPTGRPDQRRPDCPGWCTRTHDEASDETVMHESMAVAVSGIQVQVNRLLGSETDRCYVTGEADLTFDEVRELRDRLSEMLVLMGGELDDLHTTFQAMVVAAFGPDDNPGDPLAFQAMLTLAAKEAAKRK
ncbi:hypothetical protein [Pseudosporangium ferrugineum]|uniref:Uncharacterized protein n=1 Tax=Pseudosporangium ferrugineum TaxID=439699 RepID=A0A2T0RSA6_9ACTN|nr:hypothetical protein [Pseudosporangium ferrugineum]PRY24022.1 hypothetical protein CLV70_114155 [Pseudosporangium ferrugineum]